MATYNRTVTFQLTNADQTITGLGTTSNTTRYIRSVHATNVTASTVTWNFGLTALAAGSGTADVFGESIAANSRANPLYFGGKGKRVDQTGVVRGFASANTAVNVTVVYDEVDIT